MVRVEPSTPRLAPFPLNTSVKFVTTRARTHGKLMLCVTHKSEGALKGGVYLFDC